MVQSQFTMLEATSCFRPHVSHSIPTPVVPEQSPHTEAQVTLYPRLGNSIHTTTCYHHQEALACASNLPIEIGSGVVVYSIPAAPLPNVTGYSKRERITPTSEEIAIVSNPIRIMRSQIIDPGLWQMAHHLIRPVLSRWIGQIR